LAREPALGRGAEEPALAPLSAADEPLEREEDDEREPPLTGARFVAVVAPVRVFLGAMSP